MMMTARQTAFAAFAGSVIHILPNCWLLRSIDPSNPDLSPLPEL
jgi:hypothetical protein